MALRHWCVSAFVLLCMALAQGCSSLPIPRMSGEFLQRSVVVDGTAHAYQVFVPTSRAGGIQPPVILFLHGTGERGSDGVKPTMVGLGPYIKVRPEQFPAIAVFPQAPDGFDWRGIAADIAFAALDAATREFNADPDRTYLTGLSMGGYGTWELSLLRPNRFAAIVPICGALLAPSDERELFVDAVAHEADPYAALALRLKDMPIWMFHGARDDQVPIRDDRLTIKALHAAGSDARYTEFPDANHNAWDAAYSTEALWPWLFAQHRARH